MIITIPCIECGCNGDRLGQTSVTALGERLTGYQAMKRKLIGIKLLGLT